MLKWNSKNWINICIYIEINKIDKFEVFIKHKLIKLTSYFLSSHLVLPCLIETESSITIFPFFLDVSSLEDLLISITRISQQFELSLVLFYIVY